jgi:hypothetical protein
MHFDKKTISVSLFGLFAINALLVLSVWILLTQNNEFSEQIFPLEKSAAVHTTSREIVESEEKNLLLFQAKMMNGKYPLYTQVVKTVFAKSQEHGIDPRLLMSIVETESSCNPYAVSSAGAYGLMQINYSIWKDELAIDIQKIFNMDYNMDLGISILKHYLHLSQNDLHKALHYYNNGFSLTNHAYVEKVISTVR